jgi:hypothetical protein
MKYAPTASKSLLLIRGEALSFAHASLLTPYAAAAAAAAAAAVASLVLLAWCC